MRYQNQSVALGTMHQKELILSGPFAEILGMQLVVPPGLNTDSLGTFTGEIARTDTMENTAIEKAKIGMSALGLSSGIATEGSFGPHPYLPFMPCHHEVIVFIDQSRELLLMEKIYTYKTNFSFFDFKGGEDITEFLNQIDFPRHGLIVKPKRSNRSDLIFKGIRDLSELKKAIKVCESEAEDGVIHLETDMRAHMNPTRQGVIRDLALKLIRKIENECPACHMAGFGCVECESGLPCEECGTPTELVHYEIHGCAKCDYREKVKPAGGLSFANPKYCGYCNP